MAYCMQCGAEIADDARFCPSCGAFQSSQAARPQGAPVHRVPGVDQDAEDNKLMALLSYLGPLAFVPYFVAKQSPFAQFHAVRGLNLFLLEAVYGVAMSAMDILPHMWYFWILAVVGILSIFIPFADGICRKDPWNWEYDVAESGVAAKKASLELERQESAQTPI